MQRYEIFSQRLWLLLPDGMRKREALTRITAFFYTFATMKTLMLENLSVGYDNGEREPRVVLSGINATLRAGELTVLVGGNGRGKSTLLRTLTGFQKALAGRTIYREQPMEVGIDFTRLSVSQRARMVGVVLTAQTAVRNLSVEEVVALGRSPYTDFWGGLSAGDREVVARALHLVGIEELRHRRVQTLSDGERQKMMIAKALAQQTPVIMLDEPTAFLDFRSKVDVLRLLRGLAHDTGRIVLLSTHDLEQAIPLSDKLWVIRDDNTLVVTSVEEQGLLREPTESENYTRQLLQLFASETTLSRLNHVSVLSLL